MDAAQGHSIGDEELHDFLNNAPKYFRDGERIKKCQLKNGDYIHCVLWNYHFYITGTDIVKILVWRFQSSGRQLGNMKKFEEGIFSDLRNLKPGIDASLEGPRSEFLEFLYKNGCIRTQKKQKVFYWYSVPHDALFCDAMERDIRRDNSIYSYNGYPIERRVPYPDPAVAQKYAHYAKPVTPFETACTFEQPRKVERVCDFKSDLFNIKNTLFGDARPQVGMGIGGQVNLVNAQEVREAPANGDLLLDKVFSMRNETKIPQFEDYEDDAKMRSIRFKMGMDLKRRFDDIDPDQLGFLKERCQEHLGFSKPNCEKKKLNENAQLDEGGISSSAKVRFVGMSSTDTNE